MKKFCHDCEKWHRVCPVCESFHPEFPVLDAATGFLFCSACYDLAVKNHLESKRYEPLTGKDIMPSWLRTIAILRIERIKKFAAKVIKTSLLITLVYAPSEFKVRPRDPFLYLDTYTNPYILEDLEGKEIDIIKPRPPADLREEKRR